MGVMLRREHRVRAWPNDDEQRARGCAAHVAS